MNVSIKLMVIAIVSIMTIAGVGIINDSSESDAVNYELEIDLSAIGNRATVSYNGTPVQSSTSYSLASGTTFTVSISNIATGYSFSQWYIEYPNRADHGTSLSTTYTAKLYETTIIQPQLTQAPTPDYYDIAFQANNSTYGYISPSSLSNVLSGTTIHVSGASLTIGSTNIGAYPSADTAQYDYEFVGWSVSDNDTVTSNMTITATFSRTVKQYDLEISRSAIGNNATVSYNGTPLIASTTYTLNYGTSYTVSISNIATGYSFSQWYIEYPNRADHDTNYSTTYSATLTEDTVIQPQLSQSPTPTYYNISFQANNSTYGYISPSSLSNVLSGTTIHVSGASLTIGSTNIGAYPSADTAQYDYEFVGWSVSDNDTVTSNMTITATFSRTVKQYDLEIDLSAVANYATISYNGTPLQSSSTFNLNHGTSYSVSISDVAPGYYFQEWYITIGGTSTIDTQNTFTSTISGDTVIQPRLSHSPPPPPPIDQNTYWSNNLYNGSVTIAFKLISGNKTHEMSIPLYNATLDQDDRVSWSPNGYSLNITASYPATITASLEYSGSIILSETKSLGNWTGFILTISPSSGYVSWTPMDRFNDFTSYSLMESQTQNILVWDNPQNSTIYTIQHEDTGNGTHPRFSVVDTMTFLDTYGVVLNNPSINIHDYFPQYDTVQVSIYSFAVYGDGMNINGHSWNVVGNSVTIWYTEDPQGNRMIATSSTPGAQSKTLTLNNVLITWDGTDCLLTFSTDNWTVNLGPYSNGAENLSFSGLWYFTIALNEPYTATKTEITGEWDSMLNIDESAILLIFLGVILVLGLVAHVKLRLKWLDVILVVCAAIVALTLLG